MPPPDLGSRPIERSEDMLSLYRAVMDSNVNPLRALHPAQRFQTMAVLGTMWTTIFCGAAGAWLWYGELVTLHLLVAAGFLLTGLTFARAAPVAGAAPAATLSPSPPSDGGRERRPTVVVFRH
jgi:hypothetical protein